MDDMIAWLKDEYENVFEDGSGKMTVSHGKVHKYLGMTLDYSTPGQVEISMFDYIKEIFAAFDAADPKGVGSSIKMSATPNTLFKKCIDPTCEKLDPRMAQQAFHHLLGKRAHPGTSTTITFLTTRVREPDTDDWKKLSHLMQYLKCTKSLPLILSAHESGIIKGYMDGSYGTHKNLRGHTGAGLTLGQGFPIVTSTKQKLNTRSSTESELLLASMTGVCQQFVGIGTSS
jgi:hypothetical protein